MKTFVVAWLFLCSAAMGEIPLTPAEETIRALLRQGPAKWHRSMVPEAQKNEVILRLREAAEAPAHSTLGTTILLWPDADLLLLILGDPVTIKRMVADYRAYDTRTSLDYDTKAFERSRNPAIIPYLAQDFELSESTASRVAHPPPDSGDFALIIPPRSLFSGLITTRIIEKASEFTPEMKAWAKEAAALHFRSPADFRTLMRAWWKKNQDAFSRGEYSAVVPVKKEDAGIVAAAKSPVATEAAFRSTSSAAVITPQTNSSPSPATPTPVLVPRFVPKHSFLPWLISVAVTGLLFLILRKRQ